MQKEILEADLDERLDTVAKYPEGASLQEILITPSLRLTRRSLQHRIAILIKSGRIIAIGESRARRYQIPHKENPTTEPKKEYNIPLSSDSKKIQRVVEQPIQARTPVGYNRKFLDAYRPNITCYLPDEICQRFFELGKTDGERPAGTHAREIFNRILIDLSWNSSRLEGNTYSLFKTAVLKNSNPLKIFN